MVASSGAVVSSLEKLLRAIGAGEGPDVCALPPPQVR